MAPTRLFFYGTLMDPDVRALVLGRALASTQLAPARLRNFRRVYVAGRLYPMILPRAGGTVDGLVATGLSDDDIARLNAFEGDDYGLERRTVELIGPDGAAGTQPVPVWLYRCRRAIRPSLWDWHMKLWQQSEKATFLRETRAGFAARGETPPLR